MPSTLRQWLAPLASLRLTVVLMALSIWLIFAGTWAQIDMGIWATLKTYFRAWYVFIPFQVFFPRDWAQADGIRKMIVSLGMPFPGGFVIGGLLLANLLTAHALRFKLSRKRIGIILIHLGLIILLVGELVTAIWANEARMTIAEGQTINYTEDIREVEFAVIEMQADGTDKVVAIPQWMLADAAKQKKPIADPRLPLQIVVDDFMPNSQALGPSQAAGRKPRADQGIAARTGLVIDPAPLVSGVEGGSVDIPAALVSVYHNGKKLGTWMTSIWMESMVKQNMIKGSSLQPIIVGNKTYHIALRFKREYRPYSMHLVDFRHDRYLGTNTPRNFSSEVRLVDPQTDEDREVKIYMNNPLRYRGETFYQSAFEPGDKVTILQVVRNPGWLLPYIACTIGAIGMILHFGAALLTFLSKRKKAQLPGTASPALSSSAAGTPSGFPYFAFIITLLFTFYVAAVSVRGLSPKFEDGFNLRDFGRIPTVDQGRVKPLDTLARISLMTLSNKQAWRDEDGDGKKMSAIHWMLDTLARPDIADERHVIRIDHPDVLGSLGLSVDRKLFSFNEIATNAQKLSEQHRRAVSTEANDRTKFQRAVLDLAGNLQTYASLQLPQLGSRFLLPPETMGGQWRTIADAGHHLQSHGHRDEAADRFGEIIRAWSEKDAEAFNLAVHQLSQLVEQGVSADQLARVRAEQVFYKIAPFVITMAIYVVVFILAALSWLSNDASGWARRLSRSALWLLILGLIVHSAGLLMRIYIQDRPPVTNLYSSAVFVGWGTAVIGAILERIFRNGVGSVTAAVTGFLSLIVAHHLSLDGDTMTMMQAVLDTNFWLATHVVVITLGYSATFLAGFLGILYILRGVLTQAQTPAEAAGLSRMIYGTICFAVLFSFVGTILGGIWADQSWGRFWGWDPKENGALLIVLWTALVLHARWGGLAKQRGIAILAVFGNIVTAWSWFGTNMLGVGLHSYGFMDSAIFWLLVFIATQLLIMAIGMIPAERWRSHGVTTVASRAVPG